MGAADWGARRGIGSAKVDRLAKSNRKRAKRKDEGCVCVVIYDPVKRVVYVAETREVNGLRGL